MVVREARVDRTNNDRDSSMARVLITQDTDTVTEMIWNQNGWILEPILDLLQTICPWLV